MPKLIHPIAGSIALATILSFWLSTVLAEIFLPKPAIIAVKTAIPWGFLILIPSLIATGATGFRMSGKWRGKLISAKKRRMPVIAANGLLILIPSALYLSAKARSGDFDTGFYAVQLIELVAGAVNITLLSLNMRDGLRMTGKLRRRVPC
ncbi:hypothetical protein [Paracoccus sp. SCSIO 75233]|uniref:hypothetical protein n=1 Tax=Paracoccus sp. SCSIO 75233 TaxID=3017782 RepID=UPI0022F13858|nr:hypothetical protein [Paracoccus sp. SCSIO 75233]WBU52374.1 hypothetical protein PAF12_11090 [Paracoccus sp. SCSIO 75233]